MTVGCMAVQYLGWLTEIEAENLLLNRIVACGMRRLRLPWLARPDEVC